MTLPVTPPRSAPCPSPCVDVCRMNDTTGLCEGCLRTLDEIALWSALDEEDKHAVWAALAQRRARLTPVAPMSRADPT